VNHYDDGSPQNKTPPIADGLSRDTARFLAEALNEGGYLREGPSRLSRKTYRAELETQQRPRP
jgi:hypothetical protein